METGKFNDTKVTKTGIVIGSIRWNPAANLYLGIVADPQWTHTHRQFITCSWNKSGKCINRTRPELDLI
jgi:hypothetical protein